MCLRSHIHIRFDIGVVLCRLRRYSCCLKEQRLIASEGCSCVPNLFQNASNPNCYASPQGHRALMT